MRKLPVRRTLPICLAALLIPLSAAAQQPAPANAAPPPPQLEKLEEGEAPAVTITPPQNREQITEKRGPGGKVEEVKVTTGRSTYYLKPNTPPGSALPGDLQSTTIRGAQWEVGTFGPPHEGKPAEGDTASTDAGNAQPQDKSAQPAATPQK